MQLLLKGIFYFRGFPRSCWVLEHQERIGREALGPNKVEGTQGNIIFPLITPV